METPQRILVAEDDPTFLEMFRFILEDAGYDVQSVCDGRAAWCLLQQEPAHLLITDFLMPEMSADELCRLVRGDPHYDQLPIILVTAKGFEMDLAGLCHELGIAAVFWKPFSPRCLLRAVREMLSADTSWAGAVASS